MRVAAALRRRSSVRAAAVQALTRPSHVGNASKDTVSRVASLTSRRARAASSSAPRPAGGLYGLGYLHHPDDFMKAAQAAVHVCNELVSSLEAINSHWAAAPQSMSAPTAVAVLRQLDAISDTLCKVLDPAELCRNTHASTAWREAAEATYQALAGYMYQLNAHVPLHAVLVRITTTPAIFSLLSEEEQRMAVLLQKEFERDGIHLADAERQAVVALQSQISELSARFTEKLHEPDYVPVEVPEAVLRHDVPPALMSELTMVPLGRPARTLGAPEGDAQAASAAARAAPGTDGSATPLVGHFPGIPPRDRALHVYPDGRTAATVLARVRSPEVRRLVAIAHAQVYRGNLATLEKLRATRHAVAHRNGFESFAHMVTHGRMAGCPSNVAVFLNALAWATLPRTAAEAAVLAHLKLAEASEAAGKQHRAAARTILSTLLGLDASSSSPSLLDALPAHLAATQAAGLKAWDTDFYTAKATQEASALLHEHRGRAAGGAADATFPLSALITGLRHIGRAVFGIDMVPEPAADASTEAWDCEAPSSSGSGTKRGPSVALPSWLGGAPSTLASDLVKFRVSDASDTSRLLGYVYLDLFSRPGKTAGAAHFVARCGKLSSSYDGGLEALLGAPPPWVAVNGGGATEPAARVQAPIVALVMPFSKESSRAANAPAASATANGLPASLSTCSLTFAEAETLFHETGHALHSFLSRTEFQHVAGTRGALDWVEVPSHVTEHWLTDPRAFGGWWERAPGAPPPSPQAAEAAAARVAPAAAIHSLWQGTSIATSISRAAFDLCLHGTAGVRSTLLAGAPSVLERLAAGAPPEALAAEVRAHVAALTQAGGDGGVPLVESSVLDEASSAKPKVQRGVGATDEEGATLDSVALAARVNAGYGLTPPLPGSAAHAGIVHLVSYGAAYYSYLYAAVFSTAVWEHLFAPSPLSPAAGRAYVEGILSHGGSGDPTRLLKAALGGRAPTLVPLLRKLKVLP